MEHPLHLHALSERPATTRRPWWGLGVLCAAMFVSGVDMTIVNVALPSISREMNAGINELQWVVDAFLVALGALLLLGSGIADRFGRRRVFLTGFGLFAVSSVLAAVAPSPVALIAARTLMGASVACILPPALSLMAVMFEPDARPRAVAVWATVAGIAIALGPVLGGLLVSSFGWPSVFLVNVPFALVAIPAGLALLPESTRPGAPPLDLAGVGLSILGLGGLVYALIEGVEAGWGSAEVLGSIAVGVGALGAFVAIERRRRAPLFDLGALARPRVACGALAIFALYGAMLALLFLLPQYLQYVQERSTAVSGLALLPFGLGVTAAAPWSSAVLARLGARWTLVGGLCGMAVASAPLMLLEPDTSLAVVGVALAAFGVAFSLTIAPATAVIMNDLGADRAGDGAAVNQLARQVGGALGIAAVGSVFAALYRGGLEATLVGLPAAARAAAADSIEGAARVAADLGQPLRAQLVAAADRSFDTAVRGGVGVCIAMLLLAALVSLFGLAERRSDR